MGRAKRIARRLVSLLLFFHAALCLPQASSGFKSDWEEKQDELNWKELEGKLPAYPKDENLAEFFVSAANSFRFFLDTTSISIGPDGVVRFTLVARSPSGASNVSYEGMRCKTGEYKAFAFGRSDGSWSIRPTTWRKVTRLSVHRWHEALLEDYVCTVRSTPLTVADIVRGLKGGEGLKGRPVR